MHAIETLTFPTGTTKRQITKACNERAKECGDYGHGLDGEIRFNDTVLRGIAEAQKWIKEHDRGWYDNLAIRYRAERKIYWLVKIEYHC